MKTVLAALTALMIMASPVLAENPITFMEKQTSAEVLGTDFIGTPVNGKDGKQVGKIANLVFDQNGRIALAVIGVGGVLGIGEKEVAVAFEVIKPDTAAGKRVFVIEATKEQLKAAPAYKTLNDQALAERMKEWREKAKASWTDIKAKASKAYEQAKEKVEDATKKKE